MRASGLVVWGRGGIDFEKGACGKAGELFIRAHSVAPWIQFSLTAIFIFLGLSPLAPHEREREAAC